MPPSKIGKSRHRVACDEVEQGHNEENATTYVPSGRRKSRDALLSAGLAETEARQLGIAGLLLPNGTRYPGAATVSVWALSFLDRLDALRIELAKELGRDTARG